MVNENPVAPLLREGPRAAGEATTEGVDALREPVDAVREKLETIDRRVRAFVLEHPGAAIASAVAIGYVAGRLAARR